MVQKRRCWRVGLPVLCGIAGFGTPTALADPLIGAYYYPWYLPNNGHSFSQTLRPNLAPTQAPALGWYNSSSSSLISAHIDQSHQANINFWAMSWWGPGTKEDSCILNNILTNPRASELKYAVMYESSSNSLLGPDFNKPDFSHFTQDFQYLAGHEFANPNYLTINGRPVVFIYITRAYFNTQTAHDAVANMRNASGPVRLLPLHRRRRFLSKRRRSHPRQPVGRHHGLRCLRDRIRVQGLDHGGPEPAHRDIRQRTHVGGEPRRWLCPGRYTGFQQQRH